MFAPLAIGRLDLAIYANFGAFTGVYGRHTTRVTRLRHQILAGIALTLSVTLGATMAWLDVHPWVLIVVTSLVSSAWATTALVADMKPTGSVFVIFSVAAVGSLNNPVHPALAFAIDGSAALLWGWGQLSHVMSGDFLDTESRRFLDVMSSDFLGVRGGGIAGWLFHCTSAERSQISILSATVKRSHSWVMIFTPASTLALSLGRFALVGRAAVL